MSNTVIYGLFCPVAGAIRYVGKSSEVKKRFLMHLYSAHYENSHKARWLKTLADKGLKPSLVILQEVKLHESWQAIEREWIAKALEDGWPITNLSAGGDGMSPLDEAARAMKFMQMGRAETRKRMSDSAKARWADPVKRARGLEGLANEERRKRQSESAKKRSTPEYKKMMSEKSKAAWADPSKRAAIVGGITEESRAKIGEGARKMWASASEEKKFRMLSNLESSE